MALGRLVVASKDAGDDDWPGFRPGGLAGAVRVELEVALGPNAALHWENEVRPSKIATVRSMRAARKYLLTNGQWACWLCAGGPITICALRG